MEKATAGDDVATLELTWFNNPYTIQKLEIGQEYYFQGVVAAGCCGRQMVNPRSAPPHRYRPCRSSRSIPRPTG